MEKIVKVETSKIASEQKLKFYKKQNIVEFVFNKIKNNKEIIDNIFPPNSFSLYGTKKENFTTTYEEDLQSFDKDKQWYPCNEIYNEVSVSINDFSPFDIKQGSLSDCYYISAMAAIAKYPDLILKLFVMVDIEGLKKTEKLDDKAIDKFIIKFDPNNKAEDHFSYLIKLNEYYRQYNSFLKCFFMRIRLHGEWSYILVDNQFPTVSGSLVFARSFSDDLWVPIIEKCWAKVLGGYYKTSLGSPTEGFLSLSDSPTLTITHYYLDTALDLWNKLKVSMKKEWILACIIQLKGSKSYKYKEIGLITNHCYTIIRLEETVVDGKTYRLLLLRNPHGCSYYSGNFCDVDTKWNEKLKKAVSFNDKDEACFFMSVDEYFKMFDHTFICQYEKGYVYNSYKVSKKIQTKLSNNEGMFFKVNILKKGKIFFGLHQKYKRVYGKGIKNKTCQMLITRITNKAAMENFIESVNLQYICGGDHDKSVSVNQIFEPGEYLIYTHINCSITEPIGFVLSTYAEQDFSQSIEIHQLKGLNTKSLLEKCLISMIKEKLSKDFYPLNSEINKSGDTKSYKVANLNNCENGFGIIYIENNSKACEINTTVHIKDFTNLELLSSAQLNEGTINLTTKTSSHSLVYFRKTNMKCGFTFSFTETFSYNSTQLKDIIKTKGEKKEILIKNEKTGVFIFSITHGKGHLFLFENTNKKQATIKVIFTQLTNLTSKEIKNNSYEVTLASKAQKYLELNSISNGSISVTYKYAASLK
jgi:hypothetical protein